MPKRPPPQEPQPTPLPTWTIIYAGAKTRFIGWIEARDEHDAIVRAAQHFKLRPRS